MAGGAGIVIVASVVNVIILSPNPEPNKREINSHPARLHNIYEVKIFCHRTMVVQI